jgi:hypothetical protein
MQQYYADDAKEELKELEDSVIEKIRKYLEKDDIINAARGLVAVNKELYKVEEDGRKLRLTGQLEQGIYDALRKGFTRIADNIVKTAFEHQYAHEISVLSRALRFTNEVSTLPEYLREDSG